MRKRIRLLVVAPVLLVAQGCGENAVRLELAKSLSDSASASVAQSSAYFEDADARRRAAAAAFVARDPSCLPSRRLTIQKPKPSNPRGGGASLCPAGPVADPGYMLDTLNFGPPPETVLKARVIMIAAVADYGRALAKIVGEKDPDISGELSQAAQKLDAVSSLVNLIAKDDAPTASGLLDSPQAKSVIAAAQFIAELQHEAQQVGQVRAEVRDHGVVMDQALDALVQDVATRAGGSIAGSAHLNKQALYDAYLAHRYRMSFAERRALAAEIFEAEDQEAQLADKKQIVVAALQETQAAQKGLREALLGHFTPAQRRRIAAINLDRITRAMKLVAGIGAAFA
ncbi:MAG TPA: hypothetical protein VH331_03735 [Allosphingosinicella sp.]|jgi:hypothetical protein|nr:hypothetical protein [Allosphingosinicella sp.]